MTQPDDFSRNLADLKATVAHAEDLLDLVAGDVEEIKELLGLPHLKRMLGMWPQDSGKFWYASGPQ